MKRSFITLMLMFVLVSAATTEGGQPIVNSKAPEFSLLDQYDKSYTIRQVEGSSVVLLASDKEGSVQNDQWIDKIVERYGNKVAIIGIADVRGVPFFLKNRIKNGFKKGRGRILMDWEGTVFTTYGLAKKVSNIVLIDKEGMVRHVSSGEATSDACQSLFKEIDKVQ